MPLPSRAKPVLVAVLIWMAVTVFFTLSVMARYIGMNKSLAYMLYSTALHYGLWVLLAPLLVRICARAPLFQPGQSARGRVRSVAVLVLVALVLSPLVALAYLTIAYSTYFPYRQFVPTLADFMRTDLWSASNQDFMTCIVLLVAIQAWRVWRDLESEQGRAADLERRLAVARLDALRMQLHPHFLFNTLHAVVGLIGEDPPTARRMVVALGELLRRTLDEPSAPVRGLARELELIDLYMGIQRMRLGERLSLDYDVDPAAATAGVPHLLLQPLFENAVRHGAARLAGPCAIVFRADRKGDRVHLTLENDAPPKNGHSQAFAAARTGVGLPNTLGRLQLQYGDDFTFDYAERPEGGVKIDLALPYHHCREEARDAIAPAVAGAAD